MMHHAISHTQHHTERLSIQGQKPLTRGLLLRLHQGAGLIQWGKQRHLIGNQDMFWLPQGCVSTWIPFEGCHYQVVHCSIRIEQPAQEGWVSPSRFLTALLDRLHKTMPLEYSQQLLPLVLIELNQCSLHKHSRYIPKDLLAVWQTILQGLPFDHELAALDKLAQQHLSMSLRQLWLQWHIIVAQRGQLSGLSLEALYSRLPGIKTDPSLKAAIDAYLVGSAAAVQANNQ
jgi:hypothetical protein